MMMNFIDEYKSANINEQGNIKILFPFSIYEVIPHLSIVF